MYCLSILMKGNLMNTEKTAKRPEPTTKFNIKSMTDEQLKEYAKKVRVANDAMIADIQDRNAR